MIQAILPVVTPTLVLPHKREETFLQRPLQLVPAF